MSEKDEKNLTAQPEDAAEEIADAVTEAEETVEAVAEEADGKKKKQKNRTPEEEKERALNKVKRIKKLKYGTMATVITVVFIAIVVLVNVICGVLDDRFHWNIDLTSSGLYELSDKSVEFLKTVDKDVKVDVMSDKSIFDENSMLKVVSETLERFRAESGQHISIEYTDMTKNPAVISQYKQKYNGEISNMDFVVSSGDKVRVVPINDVVTQEYGYDAYYNQTVNYSFKGEESLISAIMGVLDANPVSIAMISKNGGESICYQYEMQSIAAMKNLLEKNNFQITELDIASDELSTEKYDMAILFAPVLDLTESQIDKLSKFLANDSKYGKQLVYFASVYQSDSMPNLESFLDTWGIKVEPGYLMESDNNKAQNIMTVAGQYSGVPTAVIEDSDLTANLPSKQMPLVTPIFRPISTLFSANSGRTTQVLLSTSDTGVLIPTTKEEQEKFDFDAAERDKYNLAVLATQNFTYDNEQHTSSLVAFGGGWIADYNILTYYASLNNSDYLVTVMNALAGKEAKITVDAKSLNSTAISMTDGQVKTIRFITIWVLPAIVAIIGIAVYVRRKNK